MNQKKILLIVVGIALIITAGIYFYTDGSSETTNNQNDSTNQAVSVDDFRCQDDSDCPEEYTCYTSILCEPNEENCSDQLGDDTCHPNCFSDSDCISNTKCSEVNTMVGRVLIPARICK